ncbi:MAG: hypothetical protein LBG92_06270 [Prevotellaceae bacterium]|jgi:hypothetical protein|nr:hypothetical protein [Prevotellaceae bacterium]
MKRILFFCITVIAAACSSEQKEIHYLNVNPETVELSENETVIKIQVSSSTSWTATGSNDWYKLSMTQSVNNETVEVKINENSASEARVAYISFSADYNKIIKTVKIIQRGVPLLYSDSLALVKFYNATDGDNWNIKTGWKTANFDSWYGVTVKNGRVRSIKFENNNLSGNLIAELEKLTMLDTLSLVSEPGVTGNFPVEITRLPNLKYLNFTGTSISGNIPVETGNMTGLRTLVLSSNSLLNKTVTLPLEIGNLVDLTTLKIDSITINPTVLEKLTKLEYLSLDSCKINGEFPSHILTFANIKYISLKNNTLYGNIPPELSSLTNLESLILSGNRFSGKVPDEFIQFQNLKELRIENNFLEGVLPAEILDIENVTVCPQIGKGFTNHQC